MKATVYSIVNKSVLSACLPKTDTSMHKEANEKLYSGDRFEIVFQFGKRQKAETIFGGGDSNFNICLIHLTVEALFQSQKSGVDGILDNHIVRKPEKNLTVISGASISGTYNKRTIRSLSKWRNLSANNIEQVRHLRNHSCRVCSPRSHSYFVL